MKRGSTIFLRVAVLSIGAAILGICFFLLPLMAISDQTEFYRPILLGLYIPAVPFFFALYQTMKLLHYIDKNTAFSDMSVQALKKIKYCGVVIGMVFAAGLPYVYITADRDDAPGVLALALVITGASFVVATFAGVLQKLMQNAVAIKSENDLTV